jgi:hypothetical protein
LDKMKDTLVFEILFPERVDIPFFAKKVAETVTKLILPIF